jgi:Ornithine cyclodeaminase/mu-crystallin family
MKSGEILLLTSGEIQSLLTLDECIGAVEHAFRLYGEGSALPPAVLSMHTDAGGFHVKAGLLELGRSYFAAKVNGNFPENGSRFGFPTVQGVIILCDARNGAPLAVMDSRDVTSLRTAAAPLWPQNVWHAAIQGPSLFVAAAIRDAFSCERCHMFAASKQLSLTTGTATERCGFRRTSPRTWGSP